VWVLGHKIPREELYRLTDQMVRASRSSPANIAEGYGRFHYQENIQFCRQARGSLYELIDHFTATEECGYLDAAACTQMIEKIKATIIKLNAYIKYLKSRKQLEK
jgi:four helix bundle protein